VGSGRVGLLMHQLFIMPSGPHRIEAGSCVPGGGSAIFGPTIQNSHLPGLIASSAPAAHAHTSTTRKRMAVAPTAVAARMFYPFLCMAGLSFPLIGPATSVAPPLRPARVLGTSRLRWGYVPVIAPAKSLPAAVRASRWRSRFWSSVET